MFQLKTFVLGAILLYMQVCGDELGVPCKGPEDCTATEGSYCQTPPGECACPAGQVLSSDLTRCLLVAENYGADCEDTAQCVGRLRVGGVCSDEGTCVCKQRYHYLHGQCWLSLGLNASCSKSEQCFENHNYETLTCTAGKCVCSTGFYLRGATHCRREGKAPGDECTFDMDCRFGGQDGVCVKNQCAVGPARVRVERQLIRDEEEEEEEEEEEDEMPYARDGERRDALGCQDATDCSTLGPHGECNTGHTCWCARGYFLSDDGTTCLPELGESCTDDVDCNITFSMCRHQENGDGYCSCTVEYTPSQNNRQCLKLRKFQFNCQSAETCLNFGPLAVCEEEEAICDCNENSHFEKEQEMCWTSRGFNEACLDDKDCATASGADGVFCDITKTCQCLPGYHEASLDCRLDATELGMQCMENIDCTFENARCNAGVCDCQVGFYAQNGTDDVISCVGGIESPCTGTEDCLVDNAMCEAPTQTCSEVDDEACDVTTCVCNSTDVHLVSSADWSSCLKVADKYGDTCSESIQCQTAYGNNSDCVDGICVCIEHCHFRDNYCWPITELGEKCGRTSECYLEDGSSKSECRNGLCECLYGYEQSNRNVCTSGVNMVKSAITVLFMAVWISWTV